jgi:NAD(P)-dependent dehydrogenase (short-subunit alcohol dehydrogenase family)
MSGEKVVLITGVSSGIGRATATVLAGRGFRVFGTMRKPGENSEGPEGVEVVRLDVRDAESVRAAVQTVLDRAGRIDGLVNNAGYTLIGSLEETRLEEAKELFETNFFGVLRLSQAVLPVMREQRSGRMINLSSVAGLVPTPYQGIYSASKHALEGYSESLDYEVRQFGIRVALIEPGFTRTNMDRNSQAVREPLPAYASERNRVAEAVLANLVRGEDAASVASVILEALTSRTPKLRYAAGHQARLVSRMRRFAPSAIFGWGLRKQFGLRAA